MSGDDQTCAHFALAQVDAIGAALGACPVQIAERDEDEIDVSFGEIAILDYDVDVEIL